jgi:DNA-directed RNA polymerase specialized sigma24 family protein
VDQLTELYEQEVSQLNEISTVLEFCLNKLKTKWKHMLEMRYLREYDTGRIARQFNITENAATISLFRIRRALRECIDDKLGSMK